MIITIKNISLHASFGDMRDNNSGGGGGAKRKDSVQKKKKSKIIKQTKKSVFTKKRVANKCTKYLLFLLCHYNMNIEFANNAEYIV